MLFHPNTPPNVLCDPNEITYIGIYCYLLSLMFSSPTAKVSKYFPFYEKALTTKPKHIK